MNQTNPKNCETESRSGESLEALFRDARGELLGTLYYLIGNMEDAKDALQETFLKCWRKQDQLDSIENLKAWVFRIALNTGRDIRKTAWKRRRQSLAEDAIMFSTSESPDADLVRNEQINQLSQAVMRLRPKEQEVFLLRQNGGLSYEQIAAATGLPLGTVKTRMRAAISRLREMVGGQS
jgi:RNA polymerase sigma-70 factor (ECF subfamily)